MMNRISAPHTSAEARSGAIGGKISPMEIPAVLYFAVPLWLS
jgi:hypothetical protein